MAGLLLFLLSIAGIYGLGLATVYVVGSVSAKRTDEVKRYRTLHYNEQVAHGITGAKLRVAERGLRQIANVSGNPALDAQITLDDIDNIKEIN